MFDRVDLRWTSRTLNQNEEIFQVKLVRQRDGEEWIIPASDFTLPFVFDDRPDIFKEPGVFFWGVRILDTYRSREGSFSQLREFKFERRNIPIEPPTATREPTNTPEPPTRTPPPP